MAQQLRQAVDDNMAEVGIFNSRIEEANETIAALKK